MWSVGFPFRWISILVNFSVIKCWCFVKRRFIWLTVLEVQDCGADIGWAPMADNVVETCEGGSCSIGARCTGE